MRGWVYAGAGFDHPGKWMAMLGTDVPATGDWLEDVGVFDTQAEAFEAVEARIRVREGA